MTPRIGFDAPTIAPNGKGNARSQLELLRALVGLGSPYRFVAFVRPAGLSALTGLDVEIEVIPNHLTIAWEQIGLARVGARHDLDAIVTTTDRLPVLGGGPFLVWLFENPEHRIRETRRHSTSGYQWATDEITRRLWRRSVRRAASLLAGSAATAAEVGSIVPSVRSRMRVVHPGLVPAFTPGTGPAAPRYVLHLTSSDPRDDTETALAAFSAARASFAHPVVLKIVGDPGRRTDTIDAAIQRLELADGVELLGRVSDAELVRLYQGASVYLDTSLFEGFGYQVLEAMGCGAPVVASAVTSIPEVVAEAGILCAPGSAEEFATAVRRVLDDEALAATLRARGIERAATFTWRRAAETTAAAIDDVLGAAK